MVKFCTECFNVGTGVHEEKCSWLAGSFLIFIGLAIPFVFVKILPIFILLLAIWAPLLIIAGMKFIIPCYRKEGSLCAKCKGTSLIPIDSERAQALIKEHKILIPEIEEETTSPKSGLPWQSS
jgi:hypothetical protein